MKKLLIALLALIVVTAFILLVARGCRPARFQHPLSDDDFYTWPVDKQLEASTVIVRADWKVEGDVYRCVLAEIIKQEPGTRFEYKIGDEFPRGNQRAQPNTNYGDGQVLFFTNSPPVLRHISVISKGRLIGLHDLQLDTLRSMIQKP